MQIGTVCVPSGFDRQNCIEQYRQVMYLPKLYAGFLQPGLEAFFGALLRVKTNRILIRVIRDPLIPVQQWRNRLPLYPPILECSDS